MCYKCLSLESATLSFFCLLVCPRAPLLWADEWASFHPLGHAAVLSACPEIKRHGMQLHAHCKQKRGVGGDCRQRPFSAYLVLHKHKEGRGMRFGALSAFYFLLLPAVQVGGRLLASWKRSGAAGWRAWRIDRLGAHPFTAPLRVPKCDTWPHDWATPVCV